MLISVQIRKMILREGLNKSACADRRENFSSNEAKNRRNTGCISRFFNEMGQKIFRRDMRGDLFRASLGRVCGTAAWMPPAVKISDRYYPVFKFWARGFLCLFSGEPVIWYPAAIEDKTPPNKTRYILRRTHHDTQEPEQIRHEDCL